MRKPIKMPSPRLSIPAEDDLSPKQRELLADIRKTRGSGALGGPFAVFLQAPEYGDLAQKLGAFCRYRTSVPPRLSEFTILVLARFWRSQYEFWVHAPIAQKAGVKPATIEALRTGRTPRLGKEERAIYDFIAELHKTKRVSDKTYARVHALFGDAGMVEFVGILGYYTLVAMTLNVFRVPLPDGETYPFAEPAPAARR
ncbi:MAG: carboxymuconolactone decarboxylase family protein [Pseudomonadota bacterium]